MTLRLIIRLYMFFPRIFNNAPIAGGHEQVIH
jgi:hypothetical protein